MNRDKFWQQVNAIGKDMEKVSDSLSVFVSGLYGTGKTSLIGTLPGHVLVDLFDKSGGKILDDAVKKAKEQNLLFLIRPWYKVTKNKYATWKKQIKLDMKSGFLNNFTSYALDSATALSACMTDYFISEGFVPKGGNTLAQEKLSVTGYHHINIEYAYITGTIFPIFPVGLMTSHLVPPEENMMVSERDRPTPKHDLLLTKKLKEQVPMDFGEKYVMVKQGSKYNLLTSSSGLYNASSQLHGLGLIDKKETPDIGAIIKKAGIQIPDPIDLETLK